MSSPNSWTIGTPPKTPTPPRTPPRGFSANQLPLRLPSPHRYLPPSVPASQRQSRLPSPPQASTSVASEYASGGLSNTQAPFPPQESNILLRKTVNNLADILGGIELGDDPNIAQHNNFASRSLSSQSIQDDSNTDAVGQKKKKIKRTHEK